MRKVDRPQEQSSPQSEYGTRVTLMSELQLHSRPNQLWIRQGKPFYVKGLKGDRVRERGPQNVCVDERALRIVHVCVCVRGNVCVCTCVPVHSETPESSHLPWEQGN